MDFLKVLRTKFRSYRLEIKEIFVMGAVQLGTNIASTHYHC